MRITELLENHQQNNDDFVKKNNDNGGVEYTFHIPEDLVYFMHNNDEVYRRYIYPAIIKCTRIIKANKKPNPSIFKDAVNKAYSVYLKEFPIRELPNTLDEIDKSLCAETCKLLNDEICQHIYNGDYD